MGIEEMVLDRIPRNKDKAVYLSAISSELAIPETKVLNIVKGLRLKGKMIFSDSKGYWRAEPENINSGE